VRFRSPEKARELGRGALITEVLPGSIAAMAAIEVGDVVVAVADDTIRTTSEFNEAMGKQELGRGVRLQISRSGTTRYVFLKVQNG
jgi:serine protease Do